MKERNKLFSITLNVTAEEMKAINNDAVMKMDAGKFHQLPDGSFELKVKRFGKDSNLALMFREGLSLSNQFGPQCHDVFGLQREIIDDEK